MRNGAGKPKTVMFQCKISYHKCILFCLCPCFVGVLAYAQVGVQMSIEMDFLSQNFSLDIYKLSACFVFFLTKIGAQGLMAQTCWRDLEGKG